MRTLLVWFRQDLRLADNPALWHALQNNARIIPVYIHAPEEASNWTPGGAARWWLHHSLTALAQAFATRGARLIVRRGASLSSLLDLLRESGADGVYWNRQYEPWATGRDRAVKTALREQGFTAESFNAALLHEPWTVANKAGEPFRVFTPFWKHCLEKGIDHTVLPAPDAIASPEIPLASLAPEALGLLPKTRWDAGFHDAWQPGETGAHTQLAKFLDAAIRTYAERRNFPDEPGTSRLSPHLHLGEIGPRQIVRAVLRTLGETSSVTAEGARVFLSEIGWREFAHHLLYHFPHTVSAPLDRRFTGFEWSPNAAALRAWQLGRTGLPIVDAGMRELWTTGWMHNRVRMVVASLLTKNLLTPWQDGARWFWDTLVDADLASNTLGWQWTAGCGADAAPYFRVFNPVLQGEKFDPQGDYVRRWVPELARLPTRYLHQPWTADRATLSAAGITLGVDYPRPITDLKASREAALARFERIKRAGGDGPPGEGNRA
ncbi:MAG: cryptochrome/photolyase family protein [Thiotrichales bacterium]